MSAPVAGADGIAATPLRILLVEDDEGDALLVRELLADADSSLVVTRARTLREAEQLTGAQIDCVVLDLALPDSTGLDGLTRLQRSGAGAVVVLTGMADRAQGLAAVAAGAQDYLLKDHVDGATLERALRYAVHRHHADQVARELAQVKLLAAENARLSRGLLPAPLLTDPAVGYGARYLPGGGRLLLGGDFYDVVQTPDDAVWVLIGDVCGHGPDEAALGVALRIAWRTLVLSGNPAGNILPTLQQLLIHERHQPYLFATAAMMRISPDRATAQLWSAGHPAPLLRIGSGSWRDEVIEHQLPLGLAPDHVWTAQQIALGPRWGLLLYTDGLIEGRAAPHADALWVDGLVTLLRSLTVPGPDADPARMVSALVEAVQRSAPGHNDDIAAVMLAYPALPKPLAGSA
ncbi:PP2C family protein-serine/threonine phosphatase [Pseudonocardia sp. GCM10023141]|uniref:PP2C family protein-serine/threonine phosphatase n=1 Tax=Pseudonocardia sp. GCM10023141 TaxID=3252653 RepID=UPI00361A5EAD